MGGEKEPCAARTEGCFFLSRTPCFGCGCVGYGRGFGVQSCSSSCKRLGVGNRHCHAFPSFLARMYLQQTWIGEAHALKKNVTRVAPFCWFRFTRRDGLT